MIVPTDMQPGYEDAPELAFQPTPTLVGLVDLAAHWLSAGSAVLLLDGAPAASVGLEPERLAAIGPRLAALGAGGSAGGEVLGIPILAGVPVTGPEGERLGSLWVLSSDGRPAPKGSVPDGLRRI